jgi:hypothetical protein
MCHIVENGLLQLLKLNKPIIFLAPLYIFRSLARREGGREYFTMATSHLIMLGCPYESHMSLP